MKHLSEVFLPYDSFLEINILLIPMSSILNSSILNIKIYALSSHSYTE